VNIRLKLFRNFFIFTGFLFMDFVVKIDFWLEFAKKFQGKNINIPSIFLYNRILKLPGRSILFFKISRGIFCLICQGLQKVPSSQK